MNLSFMFKESSIGEDQRVKYHQQFGGIEESVALGYQTVWWASSGSGSIWWTGI